MMDVNVHFPYGQSFGVEPIPCIYLAKNDNQLPSVIRAFPQAGSYYNIVGSQLTGLRTRKIILFYPSSDGSWFSDYNLQNYIRSLRTRLISGCEGEIYII